MSIDGLAFVACSRALKFFSYKTYFGLYLQSIQTAEIIDCTFQDSYGTALGVVDSRVVLRDDNFLNNCLMCSNGSCVFNLFQFYECHGGGVYIERVISLSLAATVSLATTWSGGVSAVERSNVP